MEDWKAKEIGAYLSGLWSSNLPELPLGSTIIL